MDLKLLDYEVRENVAWITIQRPDSFNAMNLEAMKEMLQIANHCSSDRNVRCAVMTGSGEKAFCAGGDVGGFATNADGIEIMLKEMTANFHAAVSRFAWMRAPLIAAVNGVAAGAGLSIVAFCDLAIAADNARFTSAYTQIGLTPDGSSSFFLSRLLGRRRAMEIYLMNRSLSAQEALDWGLINRVVPQKDLMAEAGKMAAHLARGPTHAHGAIKKLLLMAPNDSLESQMERETRMIVESAIGVDGKEGVRAFVEKRKPRFTGKS